MDHAAFTYRIDPAGFRQEGINILRGEGRCLPFGIIFGFRWHVKYFQMSAQLKFKSFFRVFSINIESRIDFFRPRSANGYIRNVKEKRVCGEIVLSSGLQIFHFNNSECPMFMTSTPYPGNPSDKLKIGCRRKVFEKCSKSRTNNQNTGWNRWEHSKGMWQEKVGGKKT